MFSVVPGWSAEQAIPLQLQYSAVSGCPDSEQVWTKIALRTPEVSRVGSEGVALVLVLHVKMTESGRFTGELILHDGKEMLARRALSDTRCESLVDAMTLVSALELESVAVPLQKDPALSSDGGYDGAETVTLPPPTVVAPSQPKTTPRPNKTPYSLGAAFGVATAPLSEPLAAFGAFMELRGRTAPWLRSASLSLQYGAHTRHFGANDARFTWIASRLSVCPFGVGAGWITVEGCALLEAGGLIGKGLRIPQPATKLGAWVAPGIASQIAMRSRHTAAGILLGAVVPVFRDEFFFAPTTLANQASVVGLLAEGRVGVAF